MERESESMRSAKKNLFPTQLMFCASILFGGLTTTSDKGESSCFMSVFPSQPIPYCTDSLFPGNRSHYHSLPWSSESITVTEFSYFLLPTICTMGILTRFWILLAAHISIE